MEAKGRAEAEATRAETEARGKAAVAEAEARAVRAVADARAYEAEKAAAAPTVYLQLRQLEAESSRWKAWDGKFPTHWTAVGAAASPVMALFPPPGEVVRADAKR